MLREKLQHAAFVNTISDYNRRYLSELYGPDITRNIVIARYGIDLQRFKPKPRVRNPKLFSIVCVAALELRKGHRYLVDACSILKQSGIPFRCTLVGEGEQRRALEAQIAELGLTNEVVLVGGQTQPRVRKFVAAADVFAMQSITTPDGKTEGMPL